MLSYLISSMITKFSTFPSCVFSENVMVNLDLFIYFLSPPSWVSLDVYLEGT